MIRVAALLVLACSVACSRDERHRAVKLDPTAPVAVVIGDARVTVELADTPSTVSLGLMHRTQLAPDTGMLFFMGYERDHVFWMKNTLIPLDMIFIAHDLTVAGIVHRAQPRSERLRRAGAPSLYVLEVNGGWAEAHQVTPGTAVRFENLRLAPH